MTIIDVTQELFAYLVKFRQFKQNLPSGTQNDINVLRGELEVLFRRMEAKSSQDASLMTEYKQVMYALVIFADEIILTSNWQHAKEWEKYLLEKLFFNRNIGGNKFFQLLENVDRMSQNVITIYFLCLAFGFRGKYSQSAPELQQLKMNLFRRISSEVKQSDNRMFSEAYQLQNTGIRKLPRLWKWSHLVIAGILCFVALILIERAVVWPLVMGWSVDNVESKAVLDIDPTPASSSKKEDSEKGSSDLLTDGTSPSFTVELGSFSGEMLARHFSKQMEQQDISNRIVLQINAQSTPQYLVLSGIFKTEKEALAMLERARASSTLVTKMYVRPLSSVKGECVVGCF